MKYRFKISFFIMMFLFVALSSLHAQRIGIQGQTTKDTTNETSPMKVKKDVDDTSSGRIIPPEKFGKYKDKAETKSKLSKAALIEKLRADSAAMRIRFQERYRRLRSDSKAMRKTIQELTRTVQKLRNRIDKLKSSGEMDTQTQRQDTSVKKNTPMRKPSMQPMQKTDTASSTPSAGASDQKGKQSSDTTTIPEGTRMNPNSASLSELKSIPDLSDRLAERMEWYRRVVAPFDSVEDLKRVPGIDRQMYNQIKKYFHAGPY
jgi:DNA uptake protein ComE-like DNA-binding protein